MLPGIELTNCTGLAVPHEVMHHVVRVESSFNPYAIGVVGGRLVRQPKTLPEAVATVRMLERRGYNFSIGVAQVNRYNLGKYGLDSYEKAFDVCPNLQAGSRILAECYQRSQDWGKSFSCYYSGNFVTGFRHGYVQKIYASMRKGQAGATEMGAIAVIDNPKAGGAAAAPAAYAPGRRTTVARAEPLTAREPDTAA
ncbi:lytic transglycosylase domain-containing protein, partial [Lysobacter enzymogenes]|uniref:lytic transglycosylase domain-containing protein n=1 Tax=Lysobacter enzymogenes TaxID=69 RepID=UPI0019D29C4A